MGSAAHGGGVGLIGYFGGKQGLARRFVRWLPRGCDTWIELFGGGLSAALEAITYHHPRRLVIAEACAPLRLAYERVRADPDLWALQWWKLVRSLRTIDDARAIDSRDQDPLRFCVRVQAGFVHSTGGIGPNEYRQMRQRGARAQHWRFVGGLLRATEMVTVADWPQALTLAGGRTYTYADPPYLGAACYAVGWTAEQQARLTCVLTERAVGLGGAIVSDYSLWPTPPWVAMPTPRRNRAAGHNSRVAERERWYTIGAAQ